MSNELQAATAQTIYWIMTSGAQCLRTDTSPPALESYNSGHWYSASSANYAISSSTSSLGGSTISAGSLPAGTPDGNYVAIPFLQAGSNPANTDAILPGITGGVPVTISGGVVGNVPSNLKQIAGQTATASGSVAFPSSIGTSTYGGADTSGTTTLLSRLTQTVLFDASGYVKSDVEDWHGVAITTTVPAAATATVSADVVQWAGDGAGIAVDGSHHPVVSGGSSGSVTVAGYAGGQDPASLLFVNPANKLLTDSVGRTTDVNSALLLQVAAGDEYIDTSTNPWNYVLMIAGSGPPTPGGGANELVRKKLRTVDGIGIQDTSAVIGQNESGS